MSKKFLTVAAGLVLAIMFIGITFAIAGKGRTTIGETSTQYDSLMAKYTNVQLSLYDNSTASGSEIVALIKGLTEDDSYSIKVTNGTGTEKTYTYTTVNATSSTVLEDIADKSETESYINPTASFKSALSYDENGEISCVSFKQR